jgi:hypothetical protein
MTTRSSVTTFNCKDFIDFIEQIDFRFLSDLNLFRGQANANWDLQPSITRRGVSSKFAKNENELIQEFRRLGRSMIASDILNNPWDLLAFAQHQGLHTRLLDWTTNPLSALWFAFENDLEVKTRAVWLLILDDKDIADTSIDLPLETARTLAFKPNHVTQRITAQNGWFTTHKFLPDREKFIPLNKNKDYVDNLYKFEIDNTLRKDILERLDQLGVNAASIYPDLSGLTKHLNWKRK